MGSRKLKWGERLRRISSRSDGDGHDRDTDENLVDDLFGVDSNACGDNWASGSKKKSKKKKTFLDIPQKVMEKIFEYLKDHDLKSLRLVNKTLSEAATEVFQTCHTPIVIDTDDSIFSFRKLMEASANFPFSRFRIYFKYIPRHQLISFTRRYADHIKSLRIEAFKREENPGNTTGNLYEAPSQRHITKLIGIIQELTLIQELDIVFPSMSAFDYHDMEFERDYKLGHLRVFCISFASNGFCVFSSDLAINIMQHAANLDKLVLKLHQPSNLSNARTEFVELKRVLSAADNVGVRRIWITLVILSNQNSLLDTIREAIEGGSKVRKLVLLVGPGCTEYNGITTMLYSASMTLWILEMRRIKKHWVSKPVNHNDVRIGPGVLRMPTLENLKSLDIDSYRIPIAPIHVHKQFPSLISLSLDLKYGDDGFYRKSVLHPLEKLKLHFHEIPVMRILPPFTCMDDLVSKNLTRLELNNPPPGHLAFMCNWGKNIETLIISAPQADPTYPTDKILGQLNGSMQFREGSYNHIGLLYKLRKLSLKFPIDECMARHLSELSQLWELIVDDSLLSEESIRGMRRQHNIYISCRQPAIASSPHN